ncbi:MAG: HD-GYP domain-containing protein [Azonexaceae bacterium]|nr:HD-GYP domain-containing protein [Azonexaceae bacterium]
MSHKSTVLTLDLQIGMFVSDLDRPWIETPFLMQGLLIENEAQIATLQQYCQQVIVDRSRSLGDAYAPRVHDRDAPRQSGPLPAFRQVDEARPNDFAAICRHLRVEPVLRRYRVSPDLNPTDQQSRLEAELLYSAPIVDDVKRTLKSIRDAIASAETVSLNEIGKQVSEMARSVERNPEAMIWLARLRSSDQYSYDHALDVSVHLMVFARFLGLSSKIIEQVGIAGLMQDIGKIDIPAEILNKPGNLTDEEYTLIQSHVASSLEMLLGQATFPNHVLEIVASHHERADGSGYPRRLKGERISFHGELAGLVDTYCAMTRDRAYGTAISSQKALEALIRTRGSKFRDPIVDQFIQCIGLYPIGSLVELNTGEVGVIIQQNQVRRLKPRLMILLGPDKSVERNPITLDLMMDPATPTGQPYRILHALPANAYGIDPGEFYLD